MISPEDWCPSSGLTLEPNANASVTSQEGCISLLAGPGAGKTETLAQRADFLLRTGSCPYPKRILAISFKKDASENLKDRVSLRCGRELASRFDSYTFHAFSTKLIDIFRTSLQGQDALNEDYTVGEERVPLRQIIFDDMLPLANEIVSGSTIARNAIRRTYSDVFLDEFQDCTSNQYSLILNAFQGTDIRIIAVGDTKQKIMGWAGALEGIFLRFGNDFAAKPLNLYQNFRSLDRIRRVHNRMVKEIDPPAAVPDEQISGNEGEVACEFFEDDVAEATWMSDSIEKWNNRGVPYSQIAILCNTQPHLYASKIISELDRRGIPYRNEQAVQDLCSEPIFCLVVDFLVAVYGKVEPDAWERLHQVVEKYSSEANPNTYSWDWNRFIEEKKKMPMENSDSGLVWQAVEQMLVKLGDESIRSLSHDYENEERLKRLLADIKTYVDKSFSELNPVESLKALGNAEAIRILTIHKCKGLEFHTVIVQGVETDTFFGTKEASECAYFVAISRAMKRLVVTVAEYREKLEGANNYWREHRTKHQQFLSYVEPELGGNE